MTYSMCNFVTLKSNVCCMGGHNVSFSTPYTGFHCSVFIIVIIICLVTVLCVIVVMHLSVLGLLLLC